MRKETSTVDHAIEEARRHLFQRLTTLGIAAPTVPYPAHGRIDEGKLLRGDMAGTFTKNFLLKDKKGNLYLLAVHEDRDLDLKTLHIRIGAQRRLSFASAGRMVEILGVPPGALTPLALINAPDGVITAVIDASLLQAEQVNFHPLNNTESTGLHPAELLGFIRSTGREPVLVDFDEDLS